MRTTQEGTAILDPNPRLRSAAEWRQILSELVDALSSRTGIDLQPTSWRVEDDRPGFASASSSVDVRGTINPALRLDACGVVCVTVNFGEAAWVSCDLLFFYAGRRVRGPEGGDFVYVPYSEVGWGDGRWMVDENGEWESHTTDEWWSPV